MKIISITGGVGSGKSEVLRVLQEEFDAEIIKADEVAHQLMEPGKKGYQHVVEALGDSFLNKDGSIDRSALVTVGTAMILSDTDKPEKAWEFLKWWTETEQQVTYADEIESVLGKSSRYNSANLKALEQSNWSSEQKQKILAQVNMLGAVEPVPGGYYLARNINNAFRNVVYNDASPTDALYEYTYKINAEIDKKRKEFGLELRQVAKSEK